MISASGPRERSEGDNKRREGEFKPITVLLVDDEDRVRLAVRHLLENDERFRVVGEAADGRSATQLSRELIPDVVIMDISMPSMNGLEAARIILREEPHTRVIITTAMGAEPYRRASLSVGASAFIDKDALDADLIYTIHKSIAPAKAPSKPH